MMKAWQDFLDSLSTKGGNIAVLFVASVLLAALLMHVIHHGADTSAIEDFKEALSSFTEALLFACSGNSSRQQMQDRVDTAKQGGTPSVEVGKVETVNVEAAKPTDVPKA